MKDVDIATREYIVFTEFIHMREKLVDKEGKIQLESFINKMCKKWLELVKEAKICNQAFSKEERTA